jgi:hypothetical protein
LVNYGGPIYRLVFPLIKPDRNVQHASRVRQFAAAGDRVAMTGIQTQAATQTGKRCHDAAAAQLYNCSSSSSSSRFLLLLLHGLLCSALLRVSPRRPDHNLISAPY